ncbi:L-threonine ammonia-lyase-like [Oscarella lobularis]|uniref:L-threonine ammonia-lyase-like n=1 Tax=Oscarella lobularis TaxID=121494 RepID=UPI003313852E
MSFAVDGVSVSTKSLQRARVVVDESPFTVRTPLARAVEDRLDPTLKRRNIELHLKLESMQRSGSFKMRGLANQLAHVPPSVLDGSRKLVTMSAGNYGRAFAQALRANRLQGVVCMPENAPISRAELIKSFGLDVERMPATELMTAVNRHVEEDGMTLLHPFDDVHLMLGYGSCGYEILEDVPDADVVVVCCGGGGLVSGIAAAIKLSGGEKCRIFAVEPEAAPSMYLSCKEGKAVSITPKKTIAAGLAPPFAGKNCFEFVKRFVEDVVLVTDEQIQHAVQVLFGAGLVAEPSGAAAVAAILSGKIPNIDNCKVVAVVTGGNVTPKELADLVPEKLEK